MKSILVLALLSSLSFAWAQDYKPSAEAVKSVDAQAVAFTGKHCTGPLKSRPPRQMSPAEFTQVATFMDSGMKAAAKKGLSVTLKSSLEGGNLYRM